jgi:hypothetical protein
MGFSAELNNFAKILKNITKFWNHKTENKRWLHTYSHLFIYFELVYISGQ